jgi:plastocyanin
MARSSGRWLVAGALAIVAGVGITSLATASPSGVRDAATDVTVFAGPPLKAPPPGISKLSDALAFFPRVVTVTAGQSVTFHFAGFHTITFPGTKNPYPFIAPLQAKQPATMDEGGAPLWWGGAAPILAISPLSFLPQGGATLSKPSDVRNSGLLRIFQAKAEPKPYTLTFLKPGLYRYICAVHPSMHGAVRVLPSDATAPSAEQQAAKGKAQLARAIADVRRIQSQRPTEKLAVWVGNGTFSGAEITSFFPKRLVVKTGDTVKFLSHDAAEIHTVTFGPSAYTGQIEKTFITPKLTVSPFGAFPSEPPGPPAPIVYDGANHGNGYINSGLINSFAVKATPHLIRVTFTKPGTYHFECVIHSHMDGTIVVR